MTQHRQDEDWLRYILQYRLNNINENVDELLRLLVLTRRVKSKKIIQCVYQFLAGKPAMITFSDTKPDRDQQQTKDADESRPTKRSRRRLQHLTTTWTISPLWDTTTFRCAFHHHPVKGVIKIAVPSHPLWDDRIKVLSCDDCKGRRVLCVLSFFEVAASESVGNLSATTTMTTPSLHETGISFGCGCGCACFCCAGIHRFSGSHDELLVCMTMGGRDRYSGRETCCTSGPFTS